VSATKEGYGSEVSEPQSKGGCLGCSPGCLASIVVTFLVVLGLAGFGIYYSYKKWVGFIGEITETAPVPLPVLKMTDEEREKVLDRVKEFGEAMKGEKTPEPLVLTEDELNALIARHDPEMSKRVRLSFSGENVTGKISLPLPPQFTGGEQRYLNANGTFKIGVSEGIPIVRLVSAEVKGKPIPAQMLTTLQNESFAQRSPDNPKLNEAYDNIERVKITDGKLFVYPKKKSESGEIRAKDDEKKEEPKPDSKAEIEPKTEDKTETKRDAEIKESEAAKADQRPDQKPEAKPTEPKPDGFNPADGDEAAPKAA
jgi:hypothetical protein